MSAFDEYYIDTFKNRYADFEGRARRSEYWYFVLFNFCIYCAIAMLISAGISTGNNLLFGIGTFAAVVFVLAIIIPSIAVAVRRLHDTGKSGWLLLIGLIPFGGLVLIVLYCIEGEPRTNKWGPDPKGEIEDWEL